MGHRFAELAFTPLVKAVQQEQGSRHAYAKFEGGAPANDRLGDAEAAFITARDSFYMATVGETGWPYVQHRGGPPGFVKVLDERTIGFADFRGNRQYVSVGNLRGDDRVSMFMMDYVAKRRLKLLGHARIVTVESDAQMLQRLALPGYGARVERGFVVEVAAFDWNCPQHITPRYSRREVEELVTGLTGRIAELEAQLAAASAPSSGQSTPGRGDPAATPAP
jgi:uncharacterized protein